MYRKTHYTLLYCLVLVNLLWTVTGMAQVPKTMSYQGYLKDAEGMPVNETLQMTFAIYDVSTGGTALWSESQMVVVKNGIYNVILGADTPLDLAEAAPYWLGVTVGTDDEMTPRQELTSAMYSLFVNGISVHNGNVGIGIDHPASKLEVAGAMTIGHTGDNSILNFHAANEKSASIGVQDDGGGGFFIRTGGIDQLFVTTNGDIGIGTDAPDAKLTVSGRIHAREVKVTAAAGADFVFDEEYELPTLSALEQYVTHQKHLPDIPAAADMQTQGLDIGAFQIKLLQKIEELTLYLIEQEKKLCEQDNILLTLQQENERLRQQLRQLEQKVSQ